MRWLLLCGLALSAFNLVVSKATGCPMLAAMLSTFPNFYLTALAFEAMQEQEHENFGKKMTDLLNNHNH